MQLQCTTVHMLSLADHKDSTYRPNSCCVNATTPTWYVSFIPHQERRMAPWRPTRNDQTLPQQTNPLHCQATPQPNNCQVDAGQAVGTNLRHPHTPGKHAAAAANPCTHSYGGCYNPACSARPLPPNSRQPANGDRFQCFTLRQQHQLQVQGQGKHSGCPAHEVDRSRRFV
jgi:hypothetical protein